MKIRPTVAGVNHLPFITELDIDGADGLAQLRDLLEHQEARAAEPLSMPFPEGLGHEKISEGPDWTKGDLLHHAAVAGDPEKVFEAMLVDPLAGRIDYDRLQQMTGEMLDATKRWLPQFA
jgi:alpha-galactosidase/6-phospho-beta-glucosidase family protein